MGWWIDELPMPMCVLELVYQGRNGSASFAIRYLNHAMERLEGVLLRNVKDQTVTALKEIGSAKWLTVFADVAINGSSRIVEDMLEDGSFMRMHCYQPQSGWCAVVMTDLTRENRLVQKLFQRGTKH